ncbi:hypothetical protein PV04_09405 [Phialophora macrospora]|uniref:Uncharacterized protein n=1 Tax=Phialophora macrospora TaxID=1851006 RepID=A0A0D2FCB7_9EURO|nr:hypothetical protein PV04_09405 [Phialophora macrospora]
MDLAGPFPELKSHDVSISKPKDAYLSGFTRLGEQIYYYTPTTLPSRTPPPTISDKTDDFATTTTTGTPTPSGVRDPDLIILCSWMYAHPRHIAKYTSHYRSKYPTSPLLLLRQDGGDFFWRAHATQMRNLEPAVRVIRTLCSSSSSQESKPRPKVLMHVFSNGGAWTACQLADAYKYSVKQPKQQHQEEEEEVQEVQEEHPILPIDALILDSTPSLPDPRASHAAICEALPSATTYPLTRKAGELAVWWYLAVASRVDALAGREHVTLNIRRRLNDPDGAFMQPGLRRVYIYGDGDALIPAADVESHAEEAKASRIIAREKMEDKDANDSSNGNATGIWLENFGQTRHVGHMMADPDRYWGLVEKVWRGSYEDGDAEE